MYSLLVIVGVTERLVQFIDADEGSASCTTKFVAHDGHANVMVWSVCEILRDGSGLIRIAPLI